MSYTPIEDYGFIGNLEAAPLIGPDGSIDWCCFPHLESSSVFAAILDEERGGRFAIQPADSFESEQEYVDGMPVLQTTFHTVSGTVALTDFMPISDDKLSGHTIDSIYRKVVCTEGTVECRATFEPRFDYARADTSVGHSREGVVGRGNGEQLYLWSPAPFRSPWDDRAESSFTLEEGEATWFVLQYNDREDLDAESCEEVLHETVERWASWAHSCSSGDRCQFEGEYHDVAVRSGMVLRLLMNTTTHAIAAAPTTSLPETVGGIRNWDYRYAWIRDAAFTIQAFHELGHEDEARKGFDWCLSMCLKDDPGEIAHPFYGLHHPTSAAEETLDHLEGYRGSRPVRVGNRAGKQLQLDTYGELIMAIYTATEFGAEVSAAEWEVVREVIEYVCEIWSSKDHGIWEYRAEPKHNVHSKVLCWAAIDRGLKMATDGEFDAPVDEWAAEREAIHEEVLERGYDEELGSFTQTYEGDAVDAATLQVPLVGFLPFDDDRVQGTIDTVRERLETEEGLVMRYHGDDGLPGEDNPFVLCTCWLVDCLALSGRVEEAHDVFDTVMEYVSPLGLYAEEIDPESGEHRGNFPQAFSHVGLVNSILYLNKAEDGETVEPIGVRPSEGYHV